MTASDSPAGYRPSPRPSFSSATVIARSQAVRHVWGDSEAGEVLDRIYVSNDKIHQLLFEIPADGQFTHSPEYRTVFGADEVLYAVDGDLVVANPETGQLVRVLPGEAVFFGPGTWHHAFNWGTGPVQVLEFFAPPPATGTSGVYARQQPLLTDSKYADDDLLGSIIPGAGPGLPRATAPAGTQRGRLTVIRPQDYLWRLDGDRAPVLTGIIASTPQLTVARCEVRGSNWSGWLSHFGDTGGYVLAGTLLLQPDEGRSWHELREGDGFYLPGGQRYQVRNAGADIATYLIGSAPSTDPAAVGDQATLASGGR
ncbi:MAG TPA: cupin domain-containing protein [Streptosporangiaceae bacterium]|nr:cupin domain-containing protein [Streptosporangiaceae bacterium]